MSQIIYENESVPRWDGCYFAEWRAENEIPARVAALQALGWTFSRQWKGRGGGAWFEVWCRDIRDLIVGGRSL